MQSLILASDSSIRARILRQAGFVFECVPSLVEEWEEESADPVELAISNAEKKARYVASLRREGLILSADTVVFSKGQTFGKPQNYSDALRMFQTYLTQNYSVLTALTLFYQGKIISDYDETKMILRSYSEEEYEELLPKIFSCEKSGGFGIEGLGAILLDRIEGCFYNVLGLPLHLFYGLAKKMSVNIWDFLENNE